MLRKLTTTTFIEKARAKHGDRYDYSKVVYVRSSAKVTIICPKHGEFLQEANSHLKGCGCRDCVFDARRLNTTGFIELAKMKHGDRYDYSFVDYITSLSKVKIRCKIHGMFSQLPSNHLAGQGCLDCGVDIKKSDTKEFIKRAREVHGDLYDYSLVNYVHSKTNVDIICKKHGVSSQLPKSHLTGVGCAKCGDDVKRLSTQEFINRARAKHNDLYDYSLVHYVTAFTDVKIRCRDHGVFLQLPGNHLAGQGCPGCAEYGYRTSKPGTLYYVRFDLPELTLWKIGITNLTVRERFAKFEVSPIVLWQRTWDDGSIAVKAERQILKDARYESYRYKGDALLKNGNTECFTIDIMALGNSRSIDHMAV
jgi:hypothetical protein